VKIGLSDIELWEELKRGNRLSLNSLYSRHFNTLFQYGMRMTQDSDVVRDCLQNLFIKIWLNDRKTTINISVKNYLISALRFEIINYQNREKRFPKVGLDNYDSFNLKFSVEQEFIKMEEHNEKAAQLAEAMNHLTARQKEVIYLKYFEEMEYEEIAEIMDMTIKGTYKLNARALEALRIIMHTEKAIVLAILLSLKR